MKLTGDVYCWKRIALKVDSCTNQVYVILIAFVNKLNFKIICNPKLFTQ